MPKAGPDAAPAGGPGIGARRALSAAALKLLRGRAHALRPVVMLGQHGLTDAVALELDGALDRHELVKVKLAAADAPARAAQLTALADGAGATVVQRIGHTATLYRRNRRAPVIALSSGRPRTTG